MKIVCVGGGAAGLYFALLMKKADPAHDILVVERNRRDDTFGFGVVFSDATLETFADADPETYAEITRNFRSEERRVGKEGRTGGSPDEIIKKRRVER